MTTHPHKITPGEAIPFPCWLYHQETRTVHPHWHYQRDAVRTHSLPDHVIYWHPDQPLPPDYVPGNPTETLTMVLAGNARWVSGAQPTAPTVPPGTTDEQEWHHEPVFNIAYFLTSLANADLSNPQIAEQFKLLAIRYRNEVVPLLSTPPTTPGEPTDGETQQMKTGIELIAEERSRQISQEEWTPEHDDAHTEGDLAEAACCYANPKHSPGFLARWWPWGREYWKPTPNDRRRELVKAGALIAAEIDRLNRRAAMEANK